MDYTLDGEPKYPVFSDVCADCRHLQSVAKRTCVAFPKGIPDVIWLAERRHDTPYPGDNGILFEHRLLVTSKT